MNTEVLPNYETVFKDGKFTLPNYPGVMEIAYAY